jgi:hypothetical protein
MKLSNPSIEENDLCFFGKYDIHIDSVTYISKNNIFFLTNGFSSLNSMEIYKYCYCATRVPSLITVLKNYTVYTTFYFLKEARTKIIKQIQVTL